MTGPKRRLQARALSRVTGGRFHARWSSPGTPYTMGNAWQFFMGHRFGLFNYATTALGGSVTVESFTLATP